MKITDYVVVGASGEVSNLERVVGSAIKDGRQPLGGLSTHSVEGRHGIITTYYYQAMVKYVVLIDRALDEKDFYEFTIKPNEI